MSTSWQVNDVDMDDATVKVVVDQTSGVDESNRIRRQYEGLLHGTEEGHRLGRDLPRVRLRFSFVGPSPDRYTRMTFFRAHFLELERVTLRAPDAPNEFYLFENLKVADFEPEACTVVHHGGVSIVSLDVHGALRRNLPAGGGVGGPAIAEAAIGEETTVL